MGSKASRQSVASAASDIYHGHFEEVHKVCEDFQKGNLTESLNKIMYLIGQLHSVGGAHYQYGAGSDADYPELWLMSNGKTILTQLITDAEASKLMEAASSLKTIRSELEQSRLVK